MEEIYILKENESSSDELTNKLNNSFKINELRFELDVEITQELINTIFITTNDIYIEIIKDCTQYYNNILIIVPDIFQNIYGIHFICNNFTINLNNRITTNKLYHTYFGIVEQTKTSKLTYKQCSIKIINDNLQLTYKHISGIKEIENTNIIILSNYFNNINELYKYFIKFTNSNEVIFNKWFLYTFVNNNVHVIYPSNTDITNSNNKYNVIFKE